MANWDNLATKQLQEEQATSHAAGLSEGFDANPNHLPEWWFRTPCGRLTPYQRGYFVGRELKIEELKQNE